MRGVVLAAGRGSRLGPHCADRPKCLVEIAGRALLDRQVAALTAAGATEVAVVVGWRREAFAGRDLPTFVNPHWEQTTMVDTLACASRWLDEDVTLVSYGDIVYSAATARSLAACDAAIAVSYDPHWRAMWEERFADPLDDAETFTLDSDGRVADIGGRATSVDQIEGQYLGLLRLAPAGWREMCRVRDAGPPPRHMTGLLRQVVRAGRMPVAAVPAVGPWYEFDQPTDLVTGRAVVERLDAAPPW